MGKLLGGRGVEQGEKRGKMRTHLLLDPPEPSMLQTQSRYSLPAARSLVSWRSFFFQFCFLAFTGSVFILVLNKANKKYIQANVLVYSVTQHSNVSHQGIEFSSRFAAHRARAAQATKTRPTAPGPHQVFDQTPISEHNERLSGSYITNLLKSSSRQVVHFSTSMISPRNTRNISKDGISKSSGARFYLVEPRRRQSATDAQRCWKLDVYINLILKWKGLKGKFLSCL